jgi:hypothetical protein
MHPAQMFSNPQKTKSIKTQRKGVWEMKTESKPEQDFNSDLRGMIALFTRSYMFSSCRRKITQIVDLNIVLDLG